MSDIPNELLSALRQYRGNNSDEFVFGFDQDATISAFDLLKDEFRRILALTNTNRNYTNRQLKLVLNEINYICERALADEDCE